MPCLSSSTEGIHKLDTYCAGYPEMEVQTIDCVHVLNGITVVVVNLILTGATVVPLYQLLDIVGVKAPLDEEVRGG